MGFRSGHSDIDLEPGDDFRRESDGFLEEVQNSVLDLSTSSGEWQAAHEIFRAAIRSMKPPELVRRTMLETFVTYMNFETSRNLSALIMREEQWELGSSDRLEFAVETNQQLYEANVGGIMMPELVNDIVDKFGPKLLFTEGKVLF